MKKEMKILVALSVLIILPITMVVLRMQPKKQYANAIPTPFMWLEVEDAALTDGVWNTTFDTETAHTITVSLNLTAAENPIEKVIGALRYDPDVLSIATSDAVICNNTDSESVFVDKVASTITTPGTIAVACAAKIPLRPNTTTTVAHITFTILKTATNTSLSFVSGDPSSGYATALQTYPRNNFQSPFTNDAILTILPPDEKALLTLVTSDVQPQVNTPFTVSVLMSTKGAVNAADAIVQFDPAQLQVESIKTGSAFPNYVGDVDNADRAKYMKNGEIHIIGVAGMGNNTEISGANLVLAEIVFSPLIVSDSVEIGIQFDGIGMRNDSNVVSAQTSEDILTAVQPLRMALVE